MESLIDWSQLLYYDNMLLITIRVIMFAGLFVLSSLMADIVALASKLIVYRDLSSPIAVSKPQNHFYSGC